MSANTAIIHRCSGLHCASTDPTHDLDHGVIDRLAAENNALRAALAEVWRRFPDDHADFVSDESADLAEIVMRQVQNGSEVRTPRGLGAAGSGHNRPDLERNGSDR